MLRALVLALLLVAAPAAAFDITMSEMEPIDPGLEEAPYTATLHIPCDDAALAAGPTGQGQVDVSWVGAEGVNMAGPTSAVYDVAACQADPTGTLDLPVSGTVSIDRSAPGFTPLDNVFDAAVVVQNQAGCGTCTDLTGSATMTVSANFYGAMAIEASTPLQQIAPGGTATYNLEFTNSGNAATVVRMTAANASETFAFDVPASILVERGVTENMVVTITAPEKLGWNNEQGTLFLAFSTEAAEDASQFGNNLTASLLLRSKGTGDGVQGAPGPAVALTLAAIAVARRRS